MGLRNTLSFCSRVANIERPAYKSGQERELNDMLITVCLARLSSVAYSRMQFQHAVSYSGGEDLQPRRRRRRWRPDCWTSNSTNVIAAGFVISSRRSSRRRVLPSLFKGTVTRLRDGAMLTRSLL